MHRLPKSRITKEEIEGGIYTDKYGIHSAIENEMM